MDLGPGLTELGVAGLGEVALGGRTQITALCDKAQEPHLCMGWSACCRPSQRLSNSEGATAKHCPLPARQAVPIPLTSSQPEVTWFLPAGRERGWEVN